MTTGTWLVLCDPAKQLTPEALMKRLETRRLARIRQDKDALVVTIEDGGVTEITVGFSDEPHVALENQELSEEHDRPELAKLGGRYELLFELSRAADVYNALCLIAGELEKACGGVIYDVNHRRFV